ncbi:hypothetical protein FHS81_003541 [Pseudochelatococcus contaminans]|uniref:Uncharacterized protein n=1 Tax=Pseudochelatococcus contaminans TaxID=1538103 RepID=A0A7W5Z8A7_9HYPH|nr:hypothetical protein [Pseudochelatococcus contaminans]
MPTQLAQSIPSTRIETLGGEAGAARGVGARPA